MSSFYQNDPHYYRQDRSDLEIQLRALDRQYYEARDIIYRGYDRLRPQPTYYPNYIDWGTHVPYAYTLKYLNSITGDTMQQESKQYIIIGTSGAAQHPIKHSSLAEAEKEANRLAKNKPGEEFTVFETKKAYKVEEKPVSVKVFV